MDFKVGDVVVLRSGGPKMTIAAVKADRAICIWFNRREDSHEEKTAEFLTPTLKLLTVRAAPREQAVDQAD
ncbi:MAG: DUF2158 domain-containing protein [Henriciella sp.]|nr:DUF2158 domain-containing protein [Henriciella sp.]